MTTTTKITEVVGALRDTVRGWLGAALFTFHLEVEPVPASRPKVSRWGTYYTKTYTTFRKSAEEAMARLESECLHGCNIVVVVEVVCTKPRTGKLDHPKGDIDNYEKAIFDVITKAGKHWRDDKQIVGTVAFKRYVAEGETPGFHVSAFAI